MKRQTFRSLLRLRRPILLGGAHDACSARLIERAGFDGVWASGFGISVSHCLPDAGILTMNEFLDATKFMKHAVKIPIIADCDNGHGDSINAIRTVREYEGIGIAGISVEDNVFPKRCSFYAGVVRKLEEAEPFCRKIKAIINARTNDDFFIIARTEALIAGLGVDEALRRGEAYADAGADAILMHSKSNDGREVLEAARRWPLKVPLVAIPTRYPRLSSSFLYKNGFQIIIFANQGIRASVRAEKRVFERMIKSGTADSVSSRIDSIDSVNEVIGLKKLQEDEKNYL